MHYQETGSEECMRAGVSGSSVHGYWLFTRLSIHSLFTHVFNLPNIYGALTLGQVLKMQSIGQTGKVPALLELRVVVLKWGHLCPTWSN